jgi:hypothetical protein
VAVMFIVLYLGSAGVENLYMYCSVESGGEIHIIKKRYCKNKTNVTNGPIGTIVPFDSIYILLF